jgi:peptidoglycan/xylan/chitin deacetylase (PgdA/CDA1 family)
VIAFNLSMDFEMGWGDLERLTVDDGFYRRVLDGHQHVPAVIETLDRHQLQSTWGVVGACCCTSLEELQSRAPHAFPTVAPRITNLVHRRPAYREALFCPDTVRAIERAPKIELGSHGFVHIVPNGLSPVVLRDDVAASVSVLREMTGREVRSFIPPQNYVWPDQAFDCTGIRFIRHTPSVCGFPYCDPRVPAKLSRLWNDFIRPVAHVQEPGGPNPARLLFLRIDRGRRLWRMQLDMIRALLRSGSGSLYCFSHPHNLDSAVVLERFGEFCEVIANAREQGRLTNGRFVRLLDEPLAA